MSSLLSSSFWSRDEGEQLTEKERESRMARKMNYKNKGKQIDKLKNEVKEEVRKKDAVDRCD